MMDTKVRLLEAITAASNAAGHVLVGQGSREAAASARVRMRDLLHAHFAEHDALLARLAELESERGAVPAGWALVPAAPAQPVPEPVGPVAYFDDQLALDTAAKIMQMYFEPIPGCQLKAKIQCAVAEAMGVAHANYKDAYLNMRAFAESHGLDTKTYNTGAPITPAAQPVAAPVVREPLTDDDEECWSSDGENFYKGGLGNLIDRSGGDLVPGNTVWCATARTPEPNELFSMDNLIEDMRAQAEDVAGEWADGFPDCFDAEKEELHALICDWITRCARITFFQVENVKPYVLGVEDFPGDPNPVQCHITGASHDPD